ncbi:AMP-binding protein [Brevibacterium sp. ZH18]|uniref:class I adenylate-forming enzyme family protein n=1 Tax=Brevibacterium sp. ZH18 TaxID=2927784 RepID=UPI001F60FDC0|nr:AMP-binding protein [Brevibacterium sp. ZH18]MCI4010822.1 AMP-binding protein [Brevibacterium sp. ZH18]
MPTLPGILRTTARAYPDRPALTFEKTTTTYSEFDARVDQLAAELLARGVGPGDRIVIVSPNTDAFAIGAYAGLRAGAIIAPVNPKSASAEIEHFMTDTGATVLLFGPDCTEPVSAWASDYPTTAAVVSALSLGPADFGEDVFAAAHCRPVEEVNLDIAEDADAVIIYTSGTTGKPKGALFDHHRIIWVGVNATVAFGLRLHDRILHVAPLYHSAALNLLFFPGMMAGAHQVIHSAFDPEAVLAAFEEHRISVFFGVPTMYAFLLRAPSLSSRDTSGLRVAIYGAAPMPATVAKRIFEAFPHTEIIQACGQTEGGPGGIILAHDDVKRRPSASGRFPIPNTEVRIVDADGEDVQSGEVGEMIMRGETMMKGYWSRPDATAQTIVDGWVHTGDLVQVDDEGFMTIVDRLKDMIITGGHNVYSAEVENALAAYPEIIDIAIISRSNEEWGETIVAVVTPAQNGQPTLEGLKEFAEPLLSSYKIPRELIISEIPRNPSGKIQKHKIRESLR